MKTGLSKAQKTTSIYFDEKSPWIEVDTHNTALKKRLLRYADEYPDECQQTDDDEHGGLSFRIRKGRLSFRLTAPYSEERRMRIRNRSQAKGIHCREQCNRSENIIS